MGIGIRIDVSQLAGRLAFLYLVLQGREAFQPCIERTEPVAGSRNHVKADELLDFPFPELAHLPLVIRY